MAFTMTTIVYAVSLWVYRNPKHVNTTVQISYSVTSKFKSAYFSNLIAASTKHVTVCSMLHI